MGKIISFCNKNNDANLINSSWYKLGLECSKHFTRDTLEKVIARKRIEYLNLLKKQYQHEDLEQIQYKYLFFWGFDIGNFNNI